MSIKSFLFDKAINFAAKKATGTSKIPTKDLPKLDKLNIRKAELAMKRTFLQRDVAAIENNRPLNGYALYFKQKELLKVNNELEKVTKEYNTFKAKQDAAQREFERINNF